MIHFISSIKPHSAGIALVTVLAFGLRYLQLNIGLPYLYFWDEPLMAGPALQMLKTGDYNPHFFVRLADDLLEPDRG